MKDRLTKAFESVYLTELQNAVWKLYKEGLNQYQIADRLKITQGEVSICLKFIAKKIGKREVMKFRKNRKYICLTREEILN